MSRPQIGIDRLPTRRMSNEPRESMNCKSCRKRKIKCNRLRPACEACQVFACPCIYDAIPKKRGPKTDILESLLKRVDGLEKQLKNSPNTEASPTETIRLETSASETEAAQATQPVKSTAPKKREPSSQPGLTSPVYPSPTSPTIFPDVLIDTFFARVHGKPYYILDEAATRQRAQNNQLPSHLAVAISAISIRYASNNVGYNAAVRLGEEYSNRARAELDIDEPSIENLQTLLLLSQASFQAGKGKKAYMLLAAATSMALALQLHREIPANARFTSSEREGRRRLFWTCYLMDRFAACGTKRPSLIADESIILRLPSWQLHQGTVAVEGDYFPSGANVQYVGGHGRPGQGGSAMLIGVCRILGVTNRYLAAGGVKGDSHFPWHSLSNLSKIRQELDLWAAETQDTFASLDSLFGQADSTILVLSKLIYHLVHCLIYRPFLPIDLAELSGNSQHQSWQIEATNLCFLHANAITELVEIGKASSILDWPGFVGYCICVAGTIHVHGAHYPPREGEVFSASAEFLAREMQQLSDLKYTWGGVQHQRDTLQAVYGCHAELVKSLAANPTRFSPVFQLEDFFDRYPGHYFDGGHVTFSDLVIDSVHESLTYTNHINQAQTVPDMQTPSQQALLSAQQQFTNLSMPQTGRKRRRTTGGSRTSQTLGSSGPISDMFSHPARQSSVQSQPPLSALSSDAFNNDGGPIQPFTPIMEYSLEGGPKDSMMDSMDHLDPMLSLPTPKEHQDGDGLADGTILDHTELHAQSDSDKDPFLSLLQQLAENEQSRGGPSELDFFLSHNT